MELLVSPSLSYAITNVIKKREKEGLVLRATQVNYQHASKIVKHIKSKLQQ